MQKRPQGLWKIQSLEENYTWEVNWAEPVDFSWAKGKIYCRWVWGPEEIPWPSGYILVMLREGGESSFDTSINFLLEEHEIMGNNDSVIRNV